MSPRPCYPVCMSMIQAIDACVDLFIIHLSVKLSTIINVIGKSPSASQLQEQNSVLITGLHFSATIHILTHSSLRGLGDPAITFLFLLLTGGGNIVSIDRQTQTEREEEQSKMCVLLGIADLLMFRSHGLTTRSCRELPLYSKSHSIICQFWFNRPIYSVIRKVNNERSTLFGEWKHEAQRNDC